MPPKATAARVSYLTVFTRDVERLPTFYAEVFDLPEVESSRSERYRELDAGGLMLGFPSVDAYAVLDMQDQAQPDGVRSMVTFAAETLAAVDRFTARATERGARLVKGPFATSFGQYLSVVLDPEGNAFRISAPAGAEEAP